MIGKTGTMVYFEGDWNIVQYHATRVVKWNGSQIILNHGGFMSRTTIKRMNETSNHFSLGYTVKQIKRAWIVHYKGETIQFNGNQLILERISND